MQVTQYIDSVPVSELQVGDIIVRPWDIHYVSSITKLKEFGCKNINLKQLGEVSKDLVDQTYTAGKSQKVYFNCEKVTVVRYPKEYFLALNESVRAFKNKINAIKVSSKTALSEIIAAVQYEAPSNTGHIVALSSGYELARYNQEIDLYKHIKSRVQDKLEYCNLSELGGSVAYVTAYQLADCILAGDTLDKLRERNKTCADAYAEIDRLNQVIRDAWKVTT